MLWDKHKARNHLWRIPEVILIGSAVLGGGLGVILGMRLFHHKTKHVLFYAGVPLILFLEAVGVLLIVAKVFELM